MASKAAQRVDLPVTGDGSLSPNELAELDPEEEARLLAAIDQADAAYARGEDMPAEVLLEDIDRIFNGG